MTPARREPFHRPRGIHGFNRCATAVAIELSVVCISVLERKLALRYDFCRLASSPAGAWRTCKPLKSDGKYTALQQQDYGRPEAQPNVCAYG